MSQFRFPAAALRKAFTSALPDEAAEQGNRPIRAPFLYVPRSHARALDPENLLIEGIRGSGKTLWWAALQSEDHRALVQQVISRSGIARQTQVSAGFGERMSPDDYPSQDVLAQLLENHPPRRIWKAVVLWSVARPREIQSWAEKVSWMAENPEETDRALIDCDRTLEKNKVKHLVLFDALDRAADRWDVLRGLLRGLLQVLLEFRSSKAIRLKAFLRPDMLGDPEVQRFPDASKILANKVELRWYGIDLFGLLWQYLANAPEGGEAFRQGCLDGFTIEWQERDGVWIVPESLRITEGLQRAVFHALTGPWMGRDARRGFPYLWLPNHLADAHGQTSPRSFLVALKKAAEDEQHRSEETALHYDAVKRGVQEASTVRVTEVTEDHPWVKEAGAALRGLVVPCRMEDILDRWRPPLVQDLNAGSWETRSRRADQGPEGMFQDAVDLGILYRMRDKRVNMPDVYRVGFGVGRRGGVKPVRRRL